MDSVKCVAFSKTPDKLISCTRRLYTCAQPSFPVCLPYERNESMHPTTLTKQRQGEYERQKRSLFGHLDRRETESYFCMRSCSSWGEANMTFEYNVFLRHSSKGRPAVEPMSRSIQQKYPLKCRPDKKPDEGPFDRRSIGNYTPRRFK